MSIKSERRLSRLSYLFGALIASVYIMSGCATGGVSAIPSGKAIATDVASVQALDEGRKSYVLACTECHRRYTPGERKPDDWRGILQRHEGRLSLTAEQFGRLRDYVVRASEYGAARQGK